MSDSFIQLRSGGWFDFELPSRSNYMISDIVWGLSNVCRFAGQCTPRYSVAEHSVRVAELIPENDPQRKLKALLHDASEAFMCDMPTPLKRLLPAYEQIERVVQTHIYSKFGIDPCCDAGIKKADHEMFLLEQKSLFGGAPRDGVTLPSGSQWARLEDYQKIIPWNAAKTVDRFNELFYRLREITQTNQST